MGEIEGFKEIAPYLTQPLVLVGFVLLLFFGIHRALLEAGVLPPLTARTGGKLVQNFLRYGFVIALVVIFLGFGFAFYQMHLQHDSIVQKNQGVTKRLEGLVEMAKGFCQHPEKITLDEDVQRDAMQACAKAVAALARADVSEPQKEDALARLEKGDAQGAKVLFQEILEHRSAEGKASNREAAEAARHLGALAYYDNTKEALVAYRKAVELDPDNWDGWIQLGKLLFRIGQLNDAETAFGKVKAIAELRGDRKALASVHIALANVYRLRGNMTQAEAMYKKALEIDEALGRKEGIASAYGNLGSVYLARGDLVQAEAMYKKALEIDEALGRKESMATVYGNLGIVHQLRGDLAQAEAMYKKALEIDEALGRKEGIATVYNNLGNVYLARGDLVQAEAMYKKALEIDEALGRKESMATVYGNLGIVYQTRGDLAQAEAMYKKALEIDEALGRKEGIANAYGNLGSLYQTRGDLVQAEATYKKSLALYREIGATMQTQKVQRLLDNLAASRTTAPAPKQ